MGRIHSLVPCTVGNLPDTLKERTRQMAASVWRRQASQQTTGPRSGAFEGSRMQHPLRARGIKRCHRTQDSSTPSVLSHGRTLHVGTADGLLSAAMKVVWRNVLRFGTGKNNVLPKSEVFLARQCIGPGPYLGGTPLQSLWATTKSHKQSRAKDKGTCSCVSTRRQPWGPELP